MDLLFDYWPFSALTKDVAGLAERTQRGYCAGLQLGRNQLQAIATHRDWSDG